MRYVVFIIIGILAAYAGFTIAQGHKAFADGKPATIYGNTGSSNSSRSSNSGPRPLSIDKLLQSRTEGRETNRSISGYEQLQNQKRQSSNPIFNMSDDELRARQAKRTQQLQEHRQNKISAYERRVQARTQELDSMEKQEIAAFKERVQELRAEDLMQGNILQPGQGLTTNSNEPSVLDRTAPKSENTRRQIFNRPAEQNTPRRLFGD